MKLALNAYFHAVDADALPRMAVIDERLSPEEISKQLEVDAEENGPFQLVIYDTFQAGFIGSEFNSNSETLLRGYFPSQCRAKDSTRDNDDIWLPRGLVRQARHVPWGKRTRETHLRSSCHAIGWSHRAARPAASPRVKRCFSELVSAAASHRIE
jgi:hypothetical protein